VDAGLLPVKSLGEAKHRLGTSLGERARRALADALLQDALDLCRSTSGLEWFAVTGDPEVARRARGAGIGVLPDDRHSLNGSLAAALRGLSERGVRSATVLPADVPLASSEDVLDIMDTGEVSDVVVVPSASDGGTNALHLRPPALIRPAFGPGSFRAHVQAAERLSLRCSILELVRVMLDIDTVADLETLRGREASSHTARALDQLETFPG
jgi:2-phospho-L-lactate/phosphoenolpyruvate guanylyltransferase